MALENPQEKDYDGLSRLGNALAAQMEPQSAVEIAKRGAELIAAPLENWQEKDLDSVRLLSLTNALAALATKMQPQVAAKIAAALKPQTEQGRLRPSNVKILITLPD